MENFGELKTDWDKVLEQEWGRVFVHESGHALMAVLQGIPCHGIYFEKGDGKFCAIADMPEPSEYSKKHYLVMAASSAAELIIYGDRDEAGGGKDWLDFATSGAPPLEEVVDEARAILLKNERQLKKLVSMLKAKCRQVDFNLSALPEMGMNGTAQRFAVLISKAELEDAVHSDAP